MRLNPRSFRDRTRPSRRDHRLSGHRLRPRLEPMEDRTLLSVVTSAGDSGPGTLRAAIAAAMPGDTITFAPALTGATIELTSGELAITEPLTIQGPTSGQITIDAQFQSRVFHDTAPGDVTIDNLTIERGRTTTIGGGIYAESGMLTLQGDVLAFDQARQTATGGVAMGGAVAVGGAATGLVAKANVTGNFVIGGLGGNSGTPGLPVTQLGDGGSGGDADGGGIEMDTAAILVAMSGSVSQNDAEGGAVGDGIEGANTKLGQGSGGGVYLSGPGSFDTPSLVISGNQASTADPDLYGSFL